MRSPGNTPAVGNSAGILALVKIEKKNVSDLFKMDCLVRGEKSSLKIVIYSFNYKSEMGPYGPPTYTKLRKKFVADKFLKIFF
jgi:hypothetical protein